MDQRTDPGMRALPRRSAASRLGLCAARILGLLFGLSGVTWGDETMLDTAQRLCRGYWEGFGHDGTNLCCHCRLNGPRGIDVLASPAQIARREVRGKPMPHGYGSGIQDVPLENGQFLMALCEACDATHDETLAVFGRRIFLGMKGIAGLSPVPGFVPRGPHPDGKSYYPDSSRDRAQRALQGDLFDPSVWRRLDWAGGEEDAQAQRCLDLLGLRLDQPLTVVDALAQFTPERMRDDDARRRSVANKLLFGMATVPFHQALLSGDEALIAAVAPHVRQMAEWMLAHGDAYDAGENANRTVVLALHLLAHEQRRHSRTLP
ncbi:MAG: hypothetical protein JXR77_00490 [Lentisphaeria bacterium]|nr:hypothetical protein [Lentisphaeria bacterium]